jgi:hypothetical protein
MLMSQLVAAQLQNLYSTSAAGWLCGGTSRRGPADLRTQLSAHLAVWPVQAAVRSMRQEELQRSETGLRVPPSPCHLPRSAVLP